MDSITFRYIIGMTVHATLEMYLMDVVSAYLYGSLDANIYMKVPPSLETGTLNQPASGKYRGIKLCKALYALKQSGRMCYQRLRDYLIKNNFISDPLIPCLFIKRDKTGFVIIAVYVDDLNLVGTTTACVTATNLLIREFEMKMLRKITFCIGLQIMHLTDGSIFLYQLTYIRRILQRFNMIDAYPLSTPMVGRGRDGHDPYRLCEEEEEILGD